MKCFGLGTFSINDEVNSHIKIQHDDKPTKTSERFFLKYVAFTICWPHWCSLLMLLMAPGVPRPARGDAGDYQAAGGGPVGRSATQWPLRIWAPRLQTNKWRAQTKSCGIPAENPKGNFSSCLLFLHLMHQISWFPKKYRFCICLV